MDNEQLLTYIAVQEFNNYSRAAEHLNLTQPAVTARIQKLEIELDCKLFYRDGKKILLTEEGKALLPYARKIVNYMNEAKQIMNKLKTPSISIGFSPGISVSTVLAILSSIKEKKELTFNLFEAEDSYEISKKIYEGNFDVGIVRDVVPLQELESRYIFREKMVFITGKKHPLASNKEIKYDDLIGHTMVCYRRDTPIAYQIDEKLVGVENLHRIEVGSFEIVKSMVKNNWGFCIIPELALGNEIDEIQNEFCVIPFAEFDQMTFNVTVIYKKDSPKKENLQLCIDIIKSTLHKIWTERIPSNR